MPKLLLEGPFESNYSLAIVNRGLAGGLLSAGVRPALHQRDNTTHYFPGDAFLRLHNGLAPLFERDVDSSYDIHSRYIYPPHTDGFRGAVRAVHCYGWEESVFPARFVEWFNRGVDLVTVMSEFVRKVLVDSGVTVPVHVVGLGADHILHEPAKPVPWISGDEFLFLHVSSCFPRKAPDVVAEAFCAEFTRKDPVRLVIKTFPNPHNEIARIVRELDAAFPEHAPLDVIMDPMTPAEMRFLYESAGCLVSPSRGEGFGLPVAEAMLVGCPVVATIYSGQADICREGDCWPVEYRIEPASSHVTEGHSVWANPVCDSLREQMRAVYRASAAEKLRKTQSAREFVASRFTWKQTAERHWRHCCAALEQCATPAPVSIHTNTPFVLGLITSWNTRCGIAEYSRHLASHLPAPVEVAVFANRADDVARPDEPFVRRCWSMSPEADSPDSVEELVRAVSARGVDAVSLQYNFGFFSPRQLGWLIDRLKRRQIPVAVTLHSARHATFPQLEGPLSNAAFTVCHQSSDLHAVRAIGVQNGVLRRHGIVSCADRPKRSLHRMSFTVSSFGFFLPPKGIYQLLQSFALALRVHPLMRLKLLNAIYPNADSSRYATLCVDFIERNGLAPYVAVTTAFLESDEILSQLVDSDLVVLPYMYSSESASGAAAFAVGSLTPVLTSDLPIFDELGDAVHRVRAGDVASLAGKLIDLVSDPTQLNRCHDAQERLLRAQAWPVIASDFVRLMREHAPAASKIGKAPS
jgi:glycosyltransferase involved in cell wall biosynthesis